MVSRACRFAKQGDGRDPFPRFRKLSPGRPLIGMLTFDCIRIGGAPRLGPDRRRRTRSYPVVTNCTQASWTMSCPTKKRASQSRVGCKIVATCK
jgi:hypothetical protein